MTSVNSFFKRMLVALSAGYILMYYSELVFWSKYNPAQNSPLGLMFTYLVYVIVTYIFLSVVTEFKVRSVWALFLAGAVYGWLIEGLFAQTLYESFPLQVAWTGLAWHALISVMIGWYYVTDVLLQNNYRKTIVVSILIGLFYGFWAVYWWLEEGTITPLSEFSFYAVITGLILIGSYWFFNTLRPDPFRPSRIEGLTLTGIVLFWFIFATVRIQPAALIILPPLFLFLYVGLRRNKKIEHEKDLIAVLQGDVKPLNYVLLFFIPLTAIVVYAVSLSLNLRIPTNFFVYGFTTPLGLVMVVLSVIRIFQRKSEESPENAESLQH